MHKELFLIGALSLTLVACNRPEDKPRSEFAETETEEVENTGRNARDSDSNRMTPINQSENAADRTITLQIRQALIADNNLSTDAKNVKIITINGVVTLRGVVNNNQEKNWIERKANSVNGVRNIDNQLEVKNNQGAY